MLEALADVHAAVDRCGDRALWALSEPELIDTLDAVHAAEQRLAAVKLALVREVDGRGTAAAAGATCTAVWLRDRLRLTVRTARRLLETAAALDTGPPAVREALARGAVTVEQSQTIADTLAAVPADAGPEVVDKAAHLLLDWAGRFDPAALRRLGERVLHHVAPDLADATERAALHRAEQRAHNRRHVTLTDQPDGHTRVTGVLDTEAAALLRAALDPLTTPAGPADDRSPGQRRADALGDVCRLALATGQLPDSGGDRPQIVVTVGYDPLVRGLTTGTLDTGHRITPQRVRHLACDAALLPAVLDSSNQPLDLGRQRRLFTGPLRRALVLRDRGCAFPGCDRPPRWCQGHHIRHWSDGGPTRLDNAVLLCGHHHRLIHNGHWAVRLAADGHPEFLPPTWVDPHQRPRRNHQHPRPG